MYNIIYRVFKIIQDVQIFDCGLIFFSTYFWRATIIRCNLVSKNGYKNKN